MSGVEKDAKQPRAIIHKRILESAADDPEMPMSAIANSVSGATVDLVEKVLEEYGDPADEGSGQPVKGGSAGSTGDAGPVETTAPTQMAETDAGSVAASTDGGPSAGPSTSASHGTSSDAGTPSPDPDGVPRDDERTGEAGDPAGEPADDHDQLGDQTMSTNGTDETIVEPSEGTDPAAEQADQPPEVQLSGAQLETLRAVYHRPGATQADIADALGVTRATVSRRLNDIEGFQWRSREALAEQLLPESLKGDEPDATEVDVEEPDASTIEATEDGTGEEGDARDVPEAAGELGDLHDRVDAIETRIEEVEAAPAGQPPVGSRLADGASVLDAALVHKVLSACMDSERLDETDEQRLVEFLLANASVPGGGPGDAPDD